LKNFWIERNYIKNGTEFSIDFAKNKSLSIKEKFEEIYSLLLKICKTRNAYKIETTSEMGGFFLNTHNVVFPNLPNGKLDTSIPYRILIPQINNFWIIPNMNENCFKIFVDKNNDVKILNVWMRNF